MTYLPHTHFWGVKVVLCEIYVKSSACENFGIQLPGVARL